jgi:hypothetical protein
VPKKLPIVGDLILCRGTKKGIVVELDFKDVFNYKVIWACIFWEDGTRTWEDLLCNIEDSIFEIISEKDCKT